MVVRKLTKEEYCLVLQRIIFRLGVARAFAHTGRVQLYSGPDREISNELKDEFRKAGLIYLSNWHASQAQAARESAIRIDDTYIGRLLNRKNLAVYFGDVYKDPLQVEKAAYDVWAFASRAFIASGYGHAITAVCGASDERVYRCEELDEFSKNKNYETLNDRFADAEMVIFKRDADRFQRHTSLIELRRTFRAALKEVQATGKTDVAVEYFRRKEFYLLQRRNHLIDAGKPVPLVYGLDFNERRQREAIFVLATLGLDPARPHYGAFKHTAASAVVMP